MAKKTTKDDNDDKVVKKKSLLNLDEDIKNQDKDEGDDKLVDLFFKDDDDDDEDHDDVDDQRKHIRLLTSLESSMNHSKKRRTLRPQDLRTSNFTTSINPLAPLLIKGEEDVKTKTRGKLSVKDLMKESLEEQDEDHTKNKSLIKKLSKKKLLQKPSEHNVLEVMTRRAAFEDVTKRVTQKWEDVVASNRTADQLVFPLPVLVDDDLEESTQKRAVKTTAFMTDMEVKVNSLLDSSSNRLFDDQVLTESEKEIMSSLTKEEALERQRELAKMRVLLSYQEIKNKRHSKIKSRAFRRVKKRDHLTKALKEVAENPEEALKHVKSIEKQRALERASLRHRKSGKFAKTVAIKRKFDQNARQEVQETLSLGRKLLEKKHEEDDENDSEEADSVDEVAEEKEGQEEKLLPRQEESSYNPWFKQTSSSSCKNNTDITGYDSVPNKEPTITSSSTSENNKAKKIIVLRSDVYSDDDQEDITTSKKTTKNQNTDLMREAFADDDVVIEFSQEMKDSRKEGKDEQEGSQLPGWGSWTGIGIKEKERRQDKRKTEEQEEPKKKAKEQENKVIFNPSTVLSSKRVKEIPFPFVKSAHLAFESMNSTPVGRNFVPETAFRLLTKESVVTKRGSIITPISLDTNVVKKSSNVILHAKKNQRQRQRSRQT